MEWFRHWPALVKQKFRGIPLSDGSACRPRSLNHSLEQQGLPRSRYIFKRVPKKIGEKLQRDDGDIDLAADRHEGWGLCFEESFRAHRLVLALCILYNLVSIPVLIWHVLMFGMPKLQTWAEVSGLVAWFAGDVTMPGTWWFKWADSE